jgi:hypothetical protein
LTEDLMFDSINLLRQHGFVRAVRTSCKCRCGWVLDCRMSENGPTDGADRPVSVLIRDGAELS